MDCRRKEGNGRDPAVRSSRWQGLGELNDLVGCLALPKINVASGGALSVAVEDLWNGRWHEIDDGAASVVELLMQTLNLWIVRGNQCRSHTLPAVPKGKRGLLYLQAVSEGEL